MLLNDLPQESFSVKRQFFSRSQVITVRAMHDAMIQDLSHHYTLAELSRQFGIAQTSMKLCFKAVYGSSIYQYMKSYRMQTARVLLQDTSHSVTEIAAALGYDNPSKFSEAFKKNTAPAPLYSETRRPNRMFSDGSEWQTSLIWLYFLVRKN